MAELIQREDSLNTGREKLNEAIKASDRAEQKSDQAVNTSNEAKSQSQSAENKANNVQEQFNQVVIEGDSSVEAAQARVDSEGNTYSTLKERLDDKETEINSQISQIEEETPYIFPRKRLPEETSDFNAIQEALNECEVSNKKLRLYPAPFKTYEVDGTLVNNGVDIDSEHAYIKCLTPDINLMTTTKKCELTGVTFDGDGVTNHLIFVVNELISYSKCTFQNTKESAVHTETSGSGVPYEGRCIIKDNVVINCRRGFMIYGKRVGMSVLMENNEINVTTGQPYYIQDIARVIINGGYYSGIESVAGPNCYKCDYVSIDGGEYRDVYRGATLGMDVKEGYIRDTLAVNCEYAGVSVDTKLADDSIPESIIEVSGNIGIACGITIRIQGKGVNFYNNTSKDHVGSSAPFYFNEAEAVVGENIATGGNNRCYLFNNSIIKKGKKNENRNNTYQISGDTVVTEQEIQKFSTAGDINVDTKVALGDTSASAYALKMPRYYQAIGQTIKVVKVSNDSRTLQINCYDGVLINGGLSVSINNQWDSLTLMWEGDQWVTI